MIEIETPAAKTDTPCIGGPLDGGSFCNVWPSFKWRESWSETWHLYVQAISGGRLIFRYVGVVEEAKK